MLLGLPTYWRDRYVIIAQWLQYLSRMIFPTQYTVSVIQESDL